MEQTIYEYDRSRFLEYTNDDVAKAFKQLNRTQIEALKSFPCLFAYEGKTGSVRSGQLTSIKTRSRLLLIEYNFYPNVPKIRFSSIEKIAPLLDIREWEMNRTHWAVKDEDLLDRLHQASLLDQSSISISPSAKDVDLPPADKQRTSTITTVRGFIDKVFSEKRDDHFEVFYRGHADRMTYKLEPLLFRKDAEGNYLYLDNEDILYRELLVSNSLDFASDQYTLDRLVRMQHYSLPTRLLDITSNPLIALYFACRPNFGKSPNSDVTTDMEGEVIAFSLQRKQVKYFDSDTVSCIANLARLPKREKDNIKFGAHNFNSQTAVKRLIHHIREEKSFFEAKIKPDDLRSIVCVKGKRSNDRIASQSGAQLLFGLDAVLDEQGTPDIRVSRISVTNKVPIREELDRLNINESTVFPYIENSARYVAAKYRFEKE